MIGARCLAGRYSEFGVWRADNDDQVVVAVAGELDIATAPKAWEVLAQAFERDGRIAIDLSGVTFIDSRGLKLFVRAYRRVTRDGGHLVLRHPRPFARRVLEATGFDKVFDIED
jgi:anti-sigma B factor antagonist